MNSGTLGESNLDALIDEIFDRALDVPGSHRSVYLDEACGDNVGLRARVERLLAFCDDPPSMLDGALSADLWKPEDCMSEAGSGMPARVGPYRIVEEIGHGGMGVVYRGVRADSHFERKVAIKLMRPGSDSPEARCKFEQERQIIASLQHANIARLYDGGITEYGRPYSAMELVEGKPINVYCDENRQSIAERLRLVEVVANAVHYAHQELVIHCDLKPSNILVTARGEVKLLDFGIARLLEMPGADDSSTMYCGPRAVTPLYASPEQLRGGPVTTASDVYQLGLLLFELLTGERAREISAVSRPRADDEPTGMTPQRAPSTVVRSAREDRAMAVAAARNTHPRALVHSLRNDLDLIVQAAMHSQPQRRYPSAAELVEDLKRFRRSEPLSVRRRD